MDEIIAIVTAEIAEIDRRLRDWWRELTADLPGRMWVLVFVVLASLALCVLWFYVLRP